MSGKDVVEELREIKASLERSLGEFAETLGENNRLKRAISSAISILKTDLHVSRAENARAVLEAALEDKDLPGLEDVRGILEGCERAEESQ